MRERKNITIALTNQLAHQARIEAARRNISLSTLCAESLERALRRNKERRQALAEISKYFGKVFSEEDTPLAREDIYNDRVR